MPARPVVIVTRRLPDTVEAELIERFDTRLNIDDHQFTREELIAGLQEADVLLCTLGDRISASMLRGKRRRARMLANFGVGFNHIAIDAAREHGVVVTNTPDVLTEDTADLAMLLILEVARGTSEGERQLRAGEWAGWRPTDRLGTRVHGKTLGVVGFGRIGQAVARRAYRGFGMKVLFYTPEDVPEPARRPSRAAPCPSLAELLPACDFVSLHCPATPETHHLIDAKAISRMRTSSYLINTSRGDVVDERALIAALRGRVIAGAALDVYEHEPDVPSELLRARNVVLLPHLGSATVESRVAMGRRTLANIEAFVHGREPPDRVA